MSYRSKVFQSIDEIDLAAWHEVCSQGRASIFMDPRFIAGVESSMKRSCRFWYVIIYRDDGRPVACAGLAALTIDLAELADPRLSWILRHMPVLSRFQKLNILFCSLPGSPGEKSLAWTPAGESQPILAALDGVMHDLAIGAGMDAIVFKEFGERDLLWMDRLLEAGYRRVPVPPMHIFRHSFPDFARYCAALRTRYRQQVNRSVRKLRSLDIEPSVVTDTSEVLELYTPEVHAMYCEMVARSDVKLELLPVEYFRQSKVRLSAEADLITLFKDSRIVAFGWGLHDGTTYHMTYAGLDYRLNHEGDLYFNLMYAGLDRAFRRGVETIHVGQTAAAFKARIGCDSAPLYAYAKGLGPMMSRFFRYGAGLLVVQKSAGPPANVFKSGSAPDLDRNPEASLDDRDP
jgi:predicted N-acyltransferase